MRVGAAVLVYCVEYLICEICVRSCGSNGYDMPQETGCIVCRQYMIVASGCFLKIRTCSFTVVFKYVPLPETQGHI